MKRRVAASAIFATVVALGTAVFTAPGSRTTDATRIATPGVALDASTVELVAAKATPSSTPCNNGNGVGSGSGRCRTPAPTDTPTATPSPAACSGSCKPLLTDSKPGAILTASRMKPGDIARGTVVITANGNVYVSLTESNVAHSGPAGSGNLAHRLGLVVTDQTMNVQLYGGALDSIPSSISVCGSGPPPNQPCRRWANGESHSFLFVVTFPNAGNDTDNTYQGTGAGATFVWGATR